MDLSVRMTKRQLGTFVEYIESISSDIGFKVSSRGWGYILEQKGLITKDQFDKVEGVINRCRREGLLPVDFVAEESARAFSNVEEPTRRSISAFLQDYAGAALGCHDYFTPDWWDGETHYIQMVVEKIDLVTLFEDVCARYHIPIANSKGWSSILQRAEYCRRFKAAEDKGLKCVLLYCGDHDPDGLRISETLRKNLYDVANIRWEDGEEGYDPSDLDIRRFGLEKSFIDEHRLTWIDNLITGSGRNLADPGHPNYRLPYLQSYLRGVGERKCEANSIVTVPEMGRRLCRTAIEGILGKDAQDRFEAKSEQARADIDALLESSGAGKLIRRAVEVLDE